MLNLSSASSDAFGNPIVRGRLLITSLAIILACWAEWVPSSGHWNFADEWLRDRFVNFHAVPQHDPRILVVDIDESSLKEAGPWPWPRDRIATLIENLIGIYGARGVALDIVLPEPADAAGDQRLSKLAQYGPVVLAQAFDYGNQPAPLRIGTLSGGFPADASVPANASVQADGYIANHAGLSNASHFGNIGEIPDQDGSLRRLPLWTRFDHKYYPTLSLALLQCCTDHRDFQPQQDKNGFFRVPFNQEWSAFNGAHASDILSAKVQVDEVKGKLVLIGSSALGLTDRVATPLLANTPGVLVHAASLSSLLDQQAGIAPRPWFGRWLAIAYAAATAVAAAFAFSRLSALLSILFLMANSAAWILLAYLIYPHDPLFSTTGPLASNLFLLIIAVPFDWQMTQRRSKRLLGTLRQYVARAVVDEILLSNLKDPLAPRKLNVTTLIADMEGYTTHVESLGVEEAAQVTRDFLDCLTRPVIEHHGTLDKYTGDGLVAFWGAPLPDPDHANRALDAALAIVKEVEHFNQIRKRDGKPSIRVRIGVESGMAMAGDFGTSFRSLYTAVGDSVNVASRLEDAARNFPYDVIVGPGTTELAKRHRFVALGQRVLRGKENPTQLYALDLAR